MLIHETIITKPGARKYILAFSDLQYDQFFSPRKLQTMSATFTNLIKRESIDYVFILGDVINSLNVLTLPDVYQRLLDFLRSIATHAPIVMVLGNHDSFYYDSDNHLHIAPRYLYDQYLKDLEGIPNLHLLRTSSRQTLQIFDDGAIRVLGLDLPPACYRETDANSNFHENQQIGQQAFTHLTQDCLPELTKVPHRDYYLLTHSPAYLKPGLIPPQVMVLAGHFHHGVVPPLLDELTKFSSRGLVGPGLTHHSLRRNRYELFPTNARLRPSSKQPWLTLRPITYLSDRPLQPFNIFYPRISFAFIRDDHSKPALHVCERYHFQRRLPKTI